jgi:hypothetical protein
VWGCAGDALKAFAEGRRGSEAGGGDPFYWLVSMFKQGN